MIPNLERKTMKVLDMNVEGINFVCILHFDEKTNPYHLYLRWYDGKMRQKQIRRYQNFHSVICNIKQWMEKTGKGMQDIF